jgi:hypothetical protein
MKQRKGRKPRKVRTPFELAEEAVHLRATDSECAWLELRRDTISECTVPVQLPHEIYGGDCKAV